MLSETTTNKNDSIMKKFYFEVDENDVIYAGLSSIKGISEADYNTINELGLNKAILEGLNKNKYEALVNCGFLDGFGENNRAETRFI